MRNLGIVFVNPNWSNTMKKPARVWTVGAVLAALGIWTIVGVSNGADAKKSPAAMDIEKLAAAIQKGDEDGAKSLTKTIAEKYDELDKIMHLFKSRDKKGLGVGATAKAVQPDGIELKLLDMAKKDVKEALVKKEGKALEQMGYHVAAIASVALAKPPENGGKDWKGWGEDLKTAALDLAKAAKAVDAEGVGKAVSKLNASCASCHEKYRKNN
jgi:cytochrome c556